MTKRLLLIVSLVAVVVIVTTSLPLYATDCDAELNQCMADCASFGQPTINGQSCISVCVFYYDACITYQGRYCPRSGGGSGCYEPN